MAHELPTTLFLNLMEDEEEVVEVEVGPIKLSLIWLVTTKYDFAREEGNRLIMDHNAALDSRVGKDKSMGAEGEV